MQSTPPGSACSIAFGTEIVDSEPGSARGGMGYGLTSSMPGGIGPARFLSNRRRGPGEEYNRSYS